jgi:cyclomaltodextrinase / maltogenic alpha-amylase / neopullulanase
VTDAPLLAFFRGDAGPGELLVTANGGTAATALPLPPGEWRDVIDGAIHAAVVTVPAGAWRYLMRR